MIDGINGQSISYCLYIFSVFIFFNINLYLIITLSISLCIFLIFNFKDKMFMGDSGTMLLAFIISYLLLNLTIHMENFMLMKFSHHDDTGIELVRLAVSRLLNKKHI